MSRQKPRWQESAQTMLCGLLAKKALAKPLEACSWMLQCVTKSKGGPGIVKYSKYFLVGFLQVEV